MFSIDESVDDGLVHLVLHGEVDLSCVGTIRETVAAHMTGGAAGLVIDLGDVIFIDSTGIGCLVGCRNDAERADMSYAVINPSPRVRDILNMVGVSAHLNVDQPPRDRQSS